MGDRVIACLPYLVPVLGSMRYARFMVQWFPNAMRMLYMPLQPLYQLYHSFPFAPLVIFFGIYIGLVNNRSMSRFVRYNALQAIMVDVLMLFPAMVETVFRPPMYGWGLKVYALLTSSIWTVVFAVCAFCVFNNLLGKLPQLPYLHDGVNQQIY